MKRILLVIVIAIFAVVGSGVANRVQAQTATGSVVGRVVDETDQPMIGVTVKMMPSSVASPFVPYKL